jgi:hypothetical protein
LNTSARLVVANMLLVGALGVPIGASFPPWTAGHGPQAYVFTTIDFPGANGTQAYGINAAGDIVGTFQAPIPNAKNQGFVLKRGVFAAINFPGDGTDYSNATGIGPAGDIVGVYGLKSGPPGNGHGFLLTTTGRWTTVDYPGDQLMSGPSRLLPDGGMVGCFHYGNPATSMHGYVRAPDGTTTRFDYPASGAQQSYAMHYGATPDGKMIVGVYVTPNSSGGFGAGAHNHGYVVAAGRVVSFDVPGSVTTTPMDISPTGMIVGAYRTALEASSLPHGFVAETHGSADPAQWVFTLSVDFPGASATRIRGVNAAGTIVGDYVGPDGRDHGFVARRNQPGGPSGG